MSQNTNNKNQLKKCSWNPYYYSFKRKRVGVGVPLTPESENIS